MNPGLKTLQVMHPYIEIVFCVTLISFGIMLLQKFALIKSGKKHNLYHTYAARKYGALALRKVYIRLALTLFVLGLVITSLILIEKGIMSVVWNY